MGLVQSGLVLIQDIVAAVNSVPAVGERRLQYSLCHSLVSDATKILMVVFYVIQMVHFDIHWSDFQTKKATSRDLGPFWYVTGAIPLIVFLLLVFAYQVYHALVVPLFEVYWQIGAYNLFRPLGDNTSATWYAATDGRSFLSFYWAWAVYVIVAILPRLWWLLLGTTPDQSSNRHLMPTSFLAYAFLINLCMNISYLYATMDEEYSAFHAAYVIFEATQRSVLDILDTEAILNEVGKVQGSHTTWSFLSLSFLIMIAVTIHLLACTLYVHLKADGLWSTTSLEGMLQSTDKTVRDYGRTATIFLAIYLIITTAADVILFVIRIVLAGKHLVILSSFIYKNCYYIATHLLHIYTLMLNLNLYGENNTVTPANV